MKMAAYKAVLYFTENEMDNEEVRMLLSNIKYLYPYVASLEAVEIDDWTDEHPFNKYTTMKEWFENAIILEKTRWDK